MLLRYIILSGLASFAFLNQGCRKEVGIENGGNCPASSVFSKESLAAYGNPDAPYITLADIMRLPEPADINDVLRVLGPPFSQFRYLDKAGGRFVLAFSPTKEIGGDEGVDSDNPVGTRLVAIIYETGKEHIWEGVGTYVYPARMRGKPATGFVRSDDK